MFDIAIIGGGASGLICASALAELCREDPSIAARVCIYEASDKLGRSILRSGNGRCNFSNTHIDLTEYWNCDFVRRAFEHLNAISDEKFESNDDISARSDPVVSFFWNHGLLSREERDGRLYPYPNKSSSVLDVFKRAISELDIEYELESPISDIDEPKGGSKVVLHKKSGEIVRADRVVICFGAHEALYDPIGFLHSYNYVPMLGPIRTENAFIRQLDNIRVKCDVSLLSKSGEVRSEESGEILFRKYGVSGIAVFNLSRYLQEGDRLSIDFLPDIDLDTMGEFFKERMDALRHSKGSALTNGDLLNGVVLPMISESLLASVSMDPTDMFEEESLDVLISLLKDFELECLGIGDHDICQVSRGGIDVAEIDPRTMRSYRYPNVLVCGEAIDVDGPCGGYNLHFAFASGLIAARSLYDELGR